MIEPRDCVVVLPIYSLTLTSTELLSVRSNFQILSSWPQVVLAPESLSGKIEVELFRGISGSRNYIYLEDSHFASVTTYDNLLRKKWFYELFAQFEFMLLIQTDVVVFTDDIAKWMEKGYSYIGAPWILKEGGQEKYEVGNGGLSLRRISDFINSFKFFFILKSPTWYLKKVGLPRWTHFLFQYAFGFNRWVFLPKTHEDFFWSQLIPSGSEQFKVASLDDSFMFGIEMPPSWFRGEIENNPPFGLHAWEKYLTTSDQSKVFRFIQNNARVEYL